MRWLDLLSLKVDLFKYCRRIQYHRSSHNFADYHFRFGPWNSTELNMAYMKIASLHASSPLVYIYSILMNLSTFTLVLAILEISQFESKISQYLQSFEIYSQYLKVPVEIYSFYLKELIEIYSRHPKVLVGIFSWYSEVLVVYTCNMWVDKRWPLLWNTAWQP